ncbi:hypothetical protein SHKM778_02170 [Streptomyces sp. KM77-8]|uniref:Uncharacterized protein n=1 Tax=Streptomyces haneummycinicus TaxID=3074435 RepID=A0AAT9H8T5_9ACTN
MLAVASPAAAASSATGPEEQRLSVSKSSELDPAGETVTVSGTGYDTEKGVYVAFCVDNGAGKTPTPCVGGVDMSGESGASQWVSSNPPSYGEGLAEPYKGKGHEGSFSVRIKVRAKDANTDCTASGVKCAVITRNDHTRGGDQSQTVRIPVTFRGPDRPRPHRRRAEPMTRTEPTARATQKTPATRAAPVVRTGPATAPRLHRHHRPHRRRGRGGPARGRWRGLAVGAQAPSGRARRLTPTPPTPQEGFRRWRRDPSPPP